VRLLDMISTVLRRKHEYAVAQVDVYSGMAFFWAEVVCHILHWIDKPYVLTLHGGNLPSFAKRWPRRVRNLLRSAAAVTTPSSYLLNHMSLYKSALRLLPNPLDLNAYKFSQREQVKPNLVWLRAFHSIYNPSLAPKVLASLVNKFPDIYLTMIGPDKSDGSLQEMQKLAKELGVADRIRLPGSIARAEVPSWINKSDIFLNTTNVDNSPVSVVEAMACGLCVISTNAGGIPNLLEHEHDSLVVPLDDPEAMAMAVRCVLTEPGLAKQLSRNARLKAERFDWSVILPQWQALLTSVAEANVA